MDAELQSVLALSGYVFPDDVSSGTSVVRAGTPNKPDAVAAIGNGVMVSELDGSGLVIGSYKLQNPFITSVSFGNLDYGSEELLSVDLNVRYDWAVYVIGS